MVKTVDVNYSFWLAGYYDDFINARAVADDENVPSTTTVYSSLKSHNGNPLNGEALLNPRYRWSVIDRQEYSTTLNGISGVTMAEYSDLKNLGMFEWLSHDIMRNYNSSWGGKAQLQYPNGLSGANRFKYGDGTHNTNYKDTGISSGDGYQLMANGYDSLGMYMIGCGTEDATFRRSAMEPYHTKTNGSTNNITSTEYVNKLAGKFNTWYTTSEPARNIASGHLAGVWTGECLSYATGNATNITPENLFYPLKSPGGKPFLVLKRIKGAGSTPSLIYDGALNSRLDNDVFHARIAGRCHHGDTTQSNTIRGQSFANGEYPMYVDFHVGFPVSSAGVTTTAGLTGTPAIQFRLYLGTSSGVISSTNYHHYTDYDCYGASHIGASTPTFNHDDAWLDVDIRVDYTNQKFYPYVDGVRVGLSQGYDLDNTSFGASVTADELYGYELYHEHENSGGTSTIDGVSYLMLDRVGLVRYLTSPLTQEDRTAETPITDFRLSLPNSGFSIVNMVIADDRDDDTDGSSSTNYTYNLRNLFSNTDPVDCHLLVFANEDEKRIDRPIWRGLIDNMHISQTLADRKIQLQATHYAAQLGKQVPLWDVGQLRIGNDEDDSKLYWRADNEGYKSIMNMGTRPLKMLNNKLGYGKKNGFQSNLNQRLQLGSGMPIQMYNNEDTQHGPNSIEEQYYGTGLIGFFQWMTDNNGDWLALDNDTGDNSTIRTAFGLSNQSSMADTDNVTVVNSTNHNATNKDILSIYNSTLYRDFKSYFAVDNLTYTPESTKIIYLGSYLPNNMTSDVYQTVRYVLGTAAAEAWWQAYLDANPAAANMTTGDSAVFVFDGDPGLRVGDYFTPNYLNIAGGKNNTSYTQSTNRSPIPLQFRGRHRVSSVGLGKDIYTTDRSGVLFHNVPNIHFVVTEHPVTNFDAFGLEGKYGSITSVGATLTANNRFNWCRDTGQINDSDGELNKAFYRAQHARWMRDLPKSLWFKYHFGIIDYDPLGADANVDITYGYNANDITKRTGTTGGNLVSAITKGNTEIEIPVGLFNALTAQQAWAGVAEIRAEGFWTAGPDLGKDAGTQTNKGFRFVWQGLWHDTGNSKYYMIGCKYVSQSILVGTGSKNNNGTSRTYRNVAFILPLKISDHYKHLWLLWADMRIDGNADADAGTRKTKFGLIDPIPDNYNINLHYVDKLTEDGTADKFTELKVNQDVLVWDISAIDPTTGVGFSKPVNYGLGTATTAKDISALTANSGTFGSHPSTSLLINSNSHSLSLTNNQDYLNIIGSNLHDGCYKVLDSNTNYICVDKTFQGTDTGNNKLGPMRMCPATVDTDSRYRDWEDKGGAMCIVDAAPFFNLNTYSNGGGAYQVSGGATNLTDYDVETAGFPALIDNYWAEAISSKNNKADNQGEHPNAYKVISDITALTHDLSFGDTCIQVDNMEIFSDSGTGKLIMQDEVTSSNEQTITTIYFKWTSKNTTKQEGTSVTSATLTNNNTQYILDLNGTNWVTLGIKEGMMIKNVTTGKWHTIRAVGDGTNTDVLRINRGQNKSRETQGYSWTASDDWEIPIQLGGVWTMGTVLADSVIANPNELMQELGKAYEDDGCQAASQHSVNIKDAPDETTDDYDYEVVTVSSTIWTASNTITRLLMHIDGNIESPNSGTFYESDKIRMLWNAGMTKNWNPRTRLSSFYDINTVPNTTIMTTDGGVINNDTYGGVTAAGTGNLLSILKKITKGSGFGTTNNIQTSFSWMSERDGRIGLRPKYNSGISFNRTNMKMNTLKTDVSGAITNVRVYYNNNADFIDYPTGTVSSSTRWKTLEHPDVKNRKQAANIAQKEYNNSRKTNATITIEPNATAYTEDSTTTLVDNSMVSTGRYGYVADPFISLQGKGDSSVKPTAWTRLGTGGSLFTGMTNALDGNLGTNGSLYQRWGKSGGQVNTSATDIAWADNFYWYGSASVSHAVQIVHIPNHCPLSSEETGQDLRLFVTLSPNQALADYTADTATFDIWLIDYQYANDKTKVATISDTAGTHSLATTNRYTWTRVSKSGFYELTIPRSYWNNSGAAFSPLRTMTVSFNAEYCRDLIRQRCGDPAGANIYKNANTLPGITAGTSQGNITIGNTDSIFPLGGRLYDEWYMFHGSGSRAVWNAPRIHVVRDMSYYPASYVKVTDAGLGYDDSTFTIKTVDWDRGSGGKESVRLTLSADESLRADNIEAFMPNTTLFPPTFVPHPLPIIPENSTPGVDSVPTPISGTAPGGSPLGSWWGFGQGTTSINSLDGGFFGRLTGRLNVNADSLGFGETQILGGRRTDATPTSSSGITSGVGASASGGNAASGSAGHTFPGIGLEEDGGTPYFESSFTTTLMTPSNAASDTLEVMAMITHMADGGNALLSTRILVNGVEYTQTTSLPSQTFNQPFTLFHGRVAGSEQPNTPVLIEITRDASATDDTSTYNSVVLTDLSIKQEAAQVTGTTLTSSLPPHSGFFP